MDVIHQHMNGSVDEIGSDVGGYEIDDVDGAEIGPFDLGQRNELQRYDERRNGEPYSSVEKASSVSVHRSLELEL